MPDPMIRVQFGCGSNELAGWLNTDIDRIGQSNIDVTKLPLPFENDSVDEVLAEHLVEHLTSRDAVLFLTDCHRILKKHGLIRMCCPVLHAGLNRQHSISLTKDHGHQIILDEHLMRTLLWMAGFEHESIRRTDRQEIDGHHNVIGKQLDDLETCRLTAIK